MNKDILLELALNGETQRSMALILGKSQSSIKYNLNKHNIRTAKSPELLEYEHKRCVYCKKIKHFNEFYKKNKLGIQKTSTCKKCNIYKLSIKRQRFKKECVDYKGGKCQKCNYNKCLGAMEFHHRDPTKKDFSISETHKRILSDVTDELDKCDLLCCRCHREAHEIN